jgi:hypothetical protein
MIYLQGEQPHKTHAAISLHNVFSTLPITEENKRPKAVLENQQLEDRTIAFQIPYLTTVIEI